jgi:putative Ca2+/H+ antiporter (TMEM165/GDT1 family)
MKWHSKYVYEGIFIFHLRSRSGLYESVQDVPGRSLIARLQLTTLLPGVESMEWKLFLTVFLGVFVAEMADKTQLVTMLFAADKAVSKWLVFLGSASALVLTSAIGVLVGSAMAQFVNVKTMSLIAGSGFILIGAWTLYHGLYQAQ